MRRLSIGLLAMLLATVPPVGPGGAAPRDVPDASGGAGRRPKVLVVGIDGVRSDVLARADAPHLASLGLASALRIGAVTCVPTLSGPGWASLLTGVWPAKHGVRSNELGGHRLAVYPDFLTRLERENPRAHTLAVASWPPLLSARAGGPLVGPAVDRRVLLDGDALGYAVADWKVVAAATRLLAETDVDAAFVYLGNVDVVGHASGAASRVYRDAIETADRQVGKLLAALRRRPRHGAEDWLVFVTTDHGRRDDGGHGGDSTVERRIFVAAGGTDGVPREGDALGAIVDVAPTALAHLGMVGPAAWRLDGRRVELHRRGREDYRSAHDGSGAARPLSP